MKIINKIDDGIIKFDTSNHLISDNISSDEYLSIESFRVKLFKMKLIGAYMPQDIGYGNLSIRKNYRDLYEQKYKPQFLITGTQTGRMAILTNSHYVRILDYDLHKQSISSMGPLYPSSEALTHASIYECNREIKAVFHIHHEELWNAMLENKYSKTNKNTAYGTLDMALEVKKLINIKSEGLLVLEGHQDGIIAFAKNEESCFDLINNIYEKFIID